jgi:hypothetical protein
LHSGDKWRVIALLGMIVVFEGKAGMSAAAAHIHARDDIRASPRLERSRHHRDVDVPVGRYKDLTDAASMATVAVFAS